MTNIANGCSCLGNIHNQKRFCDSSFVIRGRALSNVTVEVQVPGPGPDPFFEKLVRYTVKVIESFKGQGIAAGDEIEIFTRTNSAACGVYLSTEIEYILAGYKSDGRYRIGLCNWVGQWSNVDTCTKSFLGSSDVTTYQAKLLYKNNCNCEVKFCADLDFECINRENNNKNMCVVIGNGEPRDNSVCSKKRFGYEKPTGRCDWRECPKA